MLNILICLDKGFCEVETCRQSKGLYEVETCRQSIKTFLLCYGFHLNLFSN